MYSNNNCEDVKFQHWLKQKKTRFKNFELKKGLHIIPNIFTLGNAFFGFCSIIFAAEGELVAAAYCIFLGAMMDTLDGQMARLCMTSSNFGLQLDSLSDAVTFCLAPAFLLYSWQLYKLNFVGLFICSALLVFGILRLAKFNITASDQTNYFIGVPTPVVACLFASIVLNFGGACPHFWGRMALILLILAASSLMVSSVRVPTFKHVRKGWYAVSCAVFVSSAVAFGLVKVLLFVFVIYFLLVFIKILRSHAVSFVRKIFQHNDEQDSENNMPEVL